MTSSPGRLWRGSDPPVEQEQGDLWVNQTSNDVLVHDGRSFVALPSAGERGTLLTNGGMEVWQRGTGPFTATGAYGPDRWQITLAGGSTVQVSRDVADSGLGSLYAAAIVYTHAGGGSFSLTQSIEGFESLRGQQVTFSALVHGFAAGSIRLRVNDGATNYDSGANAGTGYGALSVTLTVPAGATTLVVGVRMDTASAGGTVDNVLLVLGASAPTWRAMAPADDLARAQRYYQEIGGLDTAEVVGAGQAFSTTTGHVPLRLPVEMAVAPTVTISAAADFSVLDATGSAVACSALAAVSVTRRSLRLNVTTAGGLTAGQGLVLRAAGTVNARITLAANP